MGKLTLKQAAGWCGGNVAPEHENVAFFGANFDTRRLHAGELFIALKGQRDGHDFAPTAMELGASAVLASRPLDPAIPAIYVADTKKALWDIAAAWRASLPCKVIGITGSVGKTTTKEMTAAVLGTKYRTAKTIGNFNNDIGVPIMLLSLDEDCEMAVLELGMNHFGEMERLARMASPDIALITNIGTMHIENLGSREGILRAKLEIMQGLRAGGTAIFNGDDDLLAGKKKDYPALTFGLHNACTVRGRDIRVVGDETQFTVETKEDMFSVTLPVLGEHNVRNALAAITVGISCGVPLKNITDALAHFENTGHRQRLTECGGIFVLDDCYNAGPESMRAALNVLTQRGGRHIAVLGGMLELGAFAPTAHYEVGRYAAERVDALFAYGENSLHYVRGAKDGGLNDAAAFDSHEALFVALKKILRTGDTVLIKGSRGMRMEKILQKLTDECGGNRHGQ